ncbi:MAG TPA: HD domain-containing phosphohydrolase [Vicinamibacterales bacterium]|jgi:putative two-component system response regulator|nr:HD domain-containing phosphohydrolase [Vicinamibacterales bacterium]
MQRTEQNTRSASGTHIGTILVVDDADASARLLERWLVADGHRVLFAHDGLEALESVRRDSPDVVLMDVLMPGLDGYETCRRLKNDPATRLVPVVLVTALTDREDRVRGLDVGADDFLSKPVNGAELTARVRSLLRIKRYTDELDSAESVIVSLAMTIEARDKTTDGHCQRLARLAARLGAAIGLGDDDVSALARGGFLHDIGKVGVPDAVLLKPARLTPAEFDIMRQHTVIGDRLCGELRSLRRVRPIVRYHHERLDGSGYPDGLKGGAVPLLAQIMSVVDVFDALTTERPYKAAMPAGRAQEELVREARLGWRDLDLVEAFFRVEEAFAAGRSSGEGAA